MSSQFTNSYFQGIPFSGKFQFVVISDLYTNVIKILVGLHQLSVMQKILYNGYQSSTTKTGFVDSEILSQDSADQEFKAKHYFRYMCSHREAFAAIRSTKVELLTENFQNITTVLLSKKIVLLKSLSHALVKEIMTLDAKGITQQVVLTTSTDS